MSSLPPPAVSTSAPECSGALAGGRVSRIVSAVVVAANGADAVALAGLTSLAAKRSLALHTIGDGPPLVLRVSGNEEVMDAGLLAAVPGVAKVMLTVPSFPLATRTPGQDVTQVAVGSVRFGGNPVQLIAGPCAVRSAAQLDEVAAALARLGIRVMRAGAFKPRTSPYAFQGTGLEGLRCLHVAAHRHGLAVLTEVMEPEAVAPVAALADMLQVGARNMSNYPLLRAVGRTRKPVLLKRSLSATYDELLGAAEYILGEGNPNVVLCERGIRTFVGDVRETLDISAVPVLKRKTHLPVIVDPSHAAGTRDLVAPLALAALAAGADGVMIEADGDPEMSPSDGAHSLALAQLEALLPRCRSIAHALGRGFLAP